MRAAEIRAARLTASARDLFRAMRSPRRALRQARPARPRARIAWPPSTCRPADPPVPEHYHLGTRQTIAQLMLAQRFPLPRLALRGPGLHLHFDRPSRHARRELCAVSRDFAIGQTIQFISSHVNSGRRATTLEPRPARAARQAPGPAERTVWSAALHYYGTVCARWPLLDMALGNFAQPAWPSTRSSASPQGAPLLSLVPP